MMEQRYHATTQNWFHPDMSTVNKNIAVEAKLISPPTYYVDNLGDYHEFSKQEIILSENLHLLCTIL